MPGSRGGITVFEAVNERLKEVYVTWTRLSIFEAMAEIGKRPAAPIAHWRPERESVSFRTLEFDLTEAAARELIARHVAKPPPSGWKYLTDDQAGF